MQVDGAALRPALRLAARTRVRRLASLAGCLATALLTACAHGPPAARTAPAAPVQDTWSTATWEERHDTMTWLVLPNMARLFREHDASPVPTLACVSCHGKNAEAIQYRMPADLPALDPAHLPTPETSATARFMIEEVTPTMKELLGVSSFGCFGCHPSRAQAGRAP